MEAEKQIIIEFGKNVGLERYVNANTKEEMSEYADLVFEMIDKAYKNIGGCGINSPEQLIKESDLMKLNRQDGKIVLVKCYKKSKFGLKSFVSATDGSDSGKKAMYALLKQDFNLTRNDLKDRHKFKRRTYVEVSGAPEHILLTKFDVNRIPNKLVQEILGKEILELHKDGFHYTRIIAGKPREKIMIGNLDFLDL